MLVSDFDFDLPEELIAQKPIPHRDQARLMVFHHEVGVIRHRRFFDLTSYVQPGDCLVLNDTRVFAARLWALKQKGTARVELLLLNRRRGKPEDDLQEWDVLVRPGRRVPPGTRLDIPGGITAEVLSVTGGGGRRIRMWGENLAQRLSEQGTLPLPPYIHRPIDNPERYQTIFARHEGSVAAPTAGLHFTDQLLQNLRQRGVVIATLTLHVGLGTFLPVRADRVQDHEMHWEQYHIPEDTAQAVNNTRLGGGRIIAVGTTVTRALESSVDREGWVQAGSGETNLFIVPGYRFQVVDVLLTNFHLPRSTLLMLVAAFCGRQPLLAAYREAVRCRYRFFSFGDAMLLLGGGFSDPAV